MLRRRHAHDEEIETQCRKHAFDHDLGRAEPVLELAAVQHHLQGADADAQCAEAEEIETAAPPALAFLDRSENTDKRKDADRNVDIEHPAPGIILGQPAAEYRPITGASVTPRPHIAMAWPWRLGGLISSRIAWLIGTSAAPETPWHSR